MKTFCTFILIIGLTLVVVSAGQATLLSYQGTFEINTSPISEIVSGDTFAFTFTYDDAITDNSVITNHGSFSGALTAFSLTAEAGNAGTWDPSGGIFTLPGSVTTSAARVIFLALGTGFPHLNMTGTFSNAQLSFNGIPITDTGGGQTLADQLGGPLSGDLSTFTSTEGAIAIFFGPRATGSLTSFSAVPVPTTLILFVTGLIGLAGYRWQQRRREGVQPA